MSEKNVKGEVDQGELFEKPLGERLREARLEQGIELDDVAHQLRVEALVLTAIEEGNKPPHGLPDVFYKGFIRNYARYLKVEISTKEASVSNPSLGAAVPGEGATSRIKRPSVDFTSMIKPVTGWGREFLADPVNRTKENPLPPAALLLSLLLVFWLLLGSDAVDEQPEVESASTEEVVIEPETKPETKPVTEPAKRVVNQAATNEGIVTIRYIDTAWTRITDRFGRVLVKRSLDAGTIKDFKGPLPLKVDLGASRVDIKFNGEPFDFLNYINDDGTVQFVLESNE